MVKNIDMLHAPDYSTMNLNQLVETINQCKKEDSVVCKNMRNFNGTFVTHK